ncbi:alpha-L-arabinofuranosidase B [Xylariaceae sp. FL0255]|nr:alpha-L-arabinofuranosidase B [Xylariaceae sp. FL0255]
MFSQPSLQYLSLGLVAGFTTVTATGPCDIYESGGTPCVAAHSTTRALYDAYDGALYQLQRGDGSTTDVYPISAGGVANATTQDEFCADESCIYDQSGQGNDLSAAPPGGAATGTGPNGYDQDANATSAPITLGGSTVYGIYISPGMGYRRDSTSGIPTGNAAQGIYAVLDGTHYNDQCCFDYGNAETNNTDNGAGHMQAIYFGSCDFWGTGEGSGPWVMADMENGLFSGESAGQNTEDPSIDYRFVTAVVKGEANYWEILVGNSQSGSLETGYAGVRPSGYTTMKQEGAIILGIGGDNSDSAEGTFYEGAITSGFPSDSVDAEVQANIVAAGYVA